MDRKEAGGEEESAFGGTKTLGYRYLDYCIDHSGRIPRLCRDAESADGFCGGQQCFRHSKTLIKRGCPVWCSRTENHHRVYSIIGMALIIAVWGFFEGFNYAVISEKINRRYPSKNQWLDYGALTCGIVCILFHPISISFWGMIEIITTFAAVYGMLMVRKKTENAWGCVFAFCFIWNAL